MWKNALFCSLLALLFSSTVVLAETTPRPARSTNIELLDGGEKLAVLNRPTNSVSLFRVRAGGRDTFLKIGEVAVGQDPRYLCLRPGADEAWVTNSASGTISRVNLRGRPRVSGEFYVGAEPRGCAFTPNGKLLLVVLRSEGRVVVIEPESGNSVLEARVGGQPEAIAITNDGDLDDLEEWAFVTQFFAQPIPGRPSEGFDDGKQGIVHAFPVATCQVTDIPLAPAPSGFTADRTAFCRQLNADAHSDIFCPDTTITDPTSEIITKDPQFAYPNQLHNLIIRHNAAFVLSTAAQPEPPVIFNNNVQAFIPVVAIDALAEDKARLTKLNDQIKTEPQPMEPTASLGRLFANDIVAVDANADGTSFLLVSRGGNYVLRARSTASGGLDIGAPGNVVRLPTGNIPTGVVVDEGFSRAYVNNEVSGSFTVLDLDGNAEIAEVPSTTTPVPGTPEHRALLGQLAFFTALGLGNDDLLSTSVRDLDLLPQRNKASDNAWSSCSSCHPDGLADAVTWIFPTGPRQTVPMDGSWGNTPGDQRIFNWSAVRSNVRDFNNNARNVQGGEGFAADPGSIFNHGLAHDVSDALDLMTFWLQSKVRTPNRPQADPALLSPGRTVFATHCASCHGGDKFTKSSIAFRNNPTFDANPLAGGQKLDDAIDNAGPQLLSVEVAAQSLLFMEQIGTFDAADPLEIRGAGQIGRTALGGLGFNVPSLLGIGMTAPYFHNGSAATLPEVFALHELPAASGQTIAESLSPTELEALELFLERLDGRTSPVASEADQFRKALIGQ